MDILLIGVNHKTAPVEVREKLALREADPPALELFNKLPACLEVVFLSTCNRVEIIAGTNDINKARQQIASTWQKFSGLNNAVFEESTYEYTGMEAARHVFRVASSLDSMVVGEPQILGQLKDAYRNASEAKCAGPILNKLMHKAFSTAKKIRTETRIASQAVSISYAAVELAKKIFGDLSGKKALLVGAGEMAELAAQHLKTNGIEKLVVANRTLERAIDLSMSLGGEAVSLEELEDMLVEVDIVISSTGAPGLVIKKDMVKRIMRPRRHKLLFFIDIAVPRDIDPSINDIDNVYL
ncbi:MAG: glutamyl-tRNA reductase, partial [Thermodesulfatator sp.]